MLTLFNLPVDIWRHHILTFVDLYDIVCLDSATLNHVDRKNLTALMYGHTLKDNFMVHAAGDERSHWCLSRNVLPDTVDAYYDFDLPQLCARASTLKLQFPSNPNSGMLHSIIQECARHLKFLFLHDCSFPSLGRLCDCSGLRSVSAGSCSELTSDAILQSLKGCNLLERFIIERCKQVDEAVISHIFGNYPSLEYVKLGGSKERTYSVANIVEACEKSTNSVLVHLELSMCSLSEEGLKKLATFAPQLQVLKVDGKNSRASDADVRDMTPFCTCLTELSLSNFRRLKNLALASIACHLPLLQRLEFVKCGNIDDEGVISIIKGCAQLKVLNLSYCIQVTDLSVQEIWTNCLQLEELNLGGCILVTDTGFPNILDRLVNTIMHTLDVRDTNISGAPYLYGRKIRILNCDTCAAVNTTFVHDFMRYEHSKWVEELSLHRTQLSVVDLLLLSKHLPQVQTLRLTHSNANDSVVLSLLHNCPHLKHLMAWDCPGVTEAYSRTNDG